MLTKSRLAELFPVAVIIVTALVVVGGLGEALVPLLIASFLAYLMLPVAKRFERRGIRKEVAAGAALGIATVLIAVALTFLIPVLYEDLRSFFADLPSLISTAFVKAEELASKFGFTLPFHEDDLFKEAQSYLSNLSADTFKSVGMILGRAVSSVATLLTAVLNLALIPIFFLYLIADYERLTGEARSLVPARHHKTFDHFAGRVNEIISGYFRGQLLVAMILGVMYGLGFTLCGLRFGVVIGLMTGCLNVIPYAGPLIGMSTATVVALANYSGMGSVLSVWVVFAIVQGLEGFVITPKIVGDRVGLNSLESMIALIVGGNLGGFVGMLIAIPVGGICKEILLACKERYLASRIYNAND